MHDAEQFAVARNEGVLVSQVLPNTPAAEAGFQEGDIITTFAGKKVHEPRELQELVERVPFDSKQEVTVLRDDANRLLRWSQVSEREISIFFATPLSGEIRVLVDGEVPLAGGKRVILPILAAGNTSSRQRQVNLFQNDERSQ